LSNEIKVREGRTEECIHGKYIKYAQHRFNIPSAWSNDSSVWAYQSYAVEICED